MFDVIFHRAATGTGDERMLQNDVDEVRPPLPVVRETLYGDSMYYGLVSFFLLMFVFFIKS